MNREPVLYAALVSILALSVQAAPPELKPEDLPRVPPVETSNVFKTFQIKKGFQMQLAAAEPLVLDPIEISFDENGRMFVVEMRDYSDVRKVVFTGFGAGKGDKLNVQALVNCLRWGMDNRIHGQTAGNGGIVKRPEAPHDAALQLQGRDFN